MVDDIDRELGAVISYLVGRQLRTGEIIEAMGVSRSGYYLARDAGRLITADHLLKIADAFGLNPIDLMVRFGLVAAEAAVEYAEGMRPAENTRPRRRKGLQRRPDAPPL